MRVAVLFSGGKDSTYTTWLLQHQAWDVYLLTVEPQSTESLMFHAPAVGWTRLQAESMGLEHGLVRTGTEAEGLGALEDALTTLKNTRGIEGMATGAVASDYQKSRFDATCEKIGIKSYAPLWHKNPRTVVNDLVETGFRVIITGVGAAGLDDSWLGRELDKASWKKLEEISVKWGLHLTGEGGEYESFVCDGPGFKKKIVIDRSRRVWDGQSGHLIIEAASLAEKTHD